MGALLTVAKTEFDGSAQTFSIKALEANTKKENSNVIRCVVLFDRIRNFPV